MEVKCVYGRGRLYKMLQKPVVMFLGGTREATSASVQRVTWRKKLVGADSRISGWNFLFQIGIHVEEVLSML